jgi:hypothetical protein
VEALAVDVQGGVHMSAEVVEEPDPPGESRRQLLVAAGEPFEAVERPHPVPLDLAGLTVQLLDRIRAEGRRDGTAGVEHRGDVPGGQECGSLLLHEGGQTLRGTGVEQNPDRR